MRTTSVGENACKQPCLTEKPFSLPRCFATACMQTSINVDVVWLQADPEGFIRSLDADTGPDADNPRACGVALLLCMLRKGSSHMAEAMLAYVTYLQVS